MTAAIKDRIVRVFLSTRPVSRRAGGLGYRAFWITRGTGTELYGSKTCESRDEAIALALKHLARLNAQPRVLMFAHTTYVDTTPPEVAS